MDEENFQRAIDIILQNQARFYSDLQQLQEEQKEAKKRADVLERVSVNLYNSTVEQGKSIKELRDSQKEPTNVLGKPTSVSGKPTSASVKLTSV